MGAEVFYQGTAQLACATFAQHLLALRQGRVRHLDHQVEATNMRSVDVFDAVAQPKARQRVFFQHAVDPTLLRALASVCTGGLEDVFDFVQYQQGGLRLQHTVGRAQRTQALFCRYRVAVAVGAGYFIKRTAQGIGE